VEHPETVVQISFLALVRLMGLVERDVPDMLLHLVLHAIQSPKPLVQYYATSALAAVLPHYRKTANWEAAREVIGPMLGMIVPLTLALAREFGISDLTHMISVIIKDPVLLPGVMEFVFDLVSAMFDFATFVSADATARADPATGVVINLVRELSGDKDAQNAICQHILHCAVQAFDDIRDTPDVAAHINVFGILALHMDPCPTEFGGLTDALAEVCFGRHPGVHLSCAYLFHNMMVRQPHEALLYFETLVQLGELFLHVTHDRAETVSVFFSALFKIAPPGSLPLPLVEDVCEFCRHTGVYDDLCGEDLIANFGQLILSLLAYAPQALECIWETVCAWAELADNLAVVCAVAIAFDVWPQDNVFQTLSDVFGQSSLEDLLHVEPDVDLVNFEWDCHEVQAVALPVFPQEVELQLVLACLRRIVAVDPDFALSLGIDDWMQCS
jgi:hypothetical protein